MKKLRTLDEILEDKKFFTEEQAQEVRKNADEESIKILHGGNTGKNKV